MLKFGRKIDMFGRKKYPVIGTGSCNTCTKYPTCSIRTRVMTIAGAVDELVTDKFSKEQTAGVSVCVYCRHYTKGRMLHNPIPLKPR